MSSTRSTTISKCYFINPPMVWIKFRDMKYLVWHSLPNWWDSGAYVWRLVIFRWNVLCKTFWKKVNKTYLKQKWVKYLVLLSWIVKLFHVDSLLMILNICSMLYSHVEFRTSASRYNYVPQAWSNGGASLPYVQPASTVQYAQPVAFAEPRVQLVAASRGLYLF